MHTTAKTSVNNKNDDIGLGLCNGVDDGIICGHRRKPTRDERLYLNLYSRHIEICDPNLDHSAEGCCFCQYREE